MNETDLRSDMHYLGSSENKITFIQNERQSIMW